MRRLLRHAFTVCSAISLVLFLLILLASAASRSDEDAGFLNIGHPPFVRVIRSNMFVYNDWIEWYALGDPNGLGVRYRVDNRGEGGRQRWEVMIPIRYPLILLAIFPALWTIGFARRVGARRNLARGHCGSCGYDLRARGTGERCPECGTAVTADV